MDQEPLLPWEPPPELLLNVGRYLVNRRWYAK